MKLKIKLDNSKYCIGCPFLGTGNAQLGYICKYYYKWLRRWIKPFTRLEQCIKENGE